MNLVERAKRLLLTPQPEWQVIDAGDHHDRGAVQPVHHPAGGDRADRAVHRVRLIGIHIPFSGVTYGPPIGRALVGAVVSYVLALVGVCVLAMIIDMLAPSFGGTHEPDAGAQGGGLLEHGGLAGGGSSRSCRRSRSSASSACTASTCCIWACRS